MAVEQTQKYCKQCRSTTLHARPGTNHVLHLLITLCLCGGWIPIWILSSLKIGGWRCQVCGSKTGGGKVLLASILVLIASPILMGYFIKSLKTSRSDELNHAEPLPKPAITPPSVVTPETQAENTDKVIFESIPQKETIAPKPTYIESLDGVVLPVKLKVIAPFSLLDPAGKDTPVSPDTVIIVNSRSSTGILTMEIGNKVYVGSERRLSKNVSLIEQ